MQKHLSCRHSWIQPVWTKKNFTHLFWLNFIMAAILNSTILDSAILHKNSSLIHSDSTWWLQPSWILPSVNSATAILDSDTLLSSLGFTQKHSHCTLTLIQTNSIWLKTHWFSPNMMMSAILNLVILNLAILVFPLKMTHMCHDWFPQFAHKKLQLFILTKLDDGSHLDICHLGFRHLVIFSQIHSKTLSLPLWLWLKLIQSDSDSFILT